MAIDDTFNDRFIEDDRFVEEDRFERLSREYMSIGGIFIPRFRKEERDEEKEPEKTDYWERIVDYVTSFFYKQ